MYQSKNQRNVLVGWGMFGTPNFAASIVMALLAPFVVSVEVFLRKDMGQRYFNYGNFIGGILVISVMRIIYSFGAALIGTEKSYHDIYFFRYVIYGYLLLSAYHFFYQWYREATYKPIHSLYLGDSRLFFIGKFAYGVLNRFVPTVVSFIARFLPEKEREDLLSREIRLKDYKAFTYLFVEPVLLIGFGWYFWGYLGLGSFWLVVSGLMLYFHTSSAFTKEWHELLDVRDSKIFAEQLQTALNDESDTLRVSETFKKRMHRMAEDAAENPDMMEEIKGNSPSVAQVLANLKKKTAVEEPTLNGQA